MKIMPRLLNSALTVTSHLPEAGYYLCQPGCFLADIRYQKKAGQLKVFFHIRGQNLSDLKQQFKNRSHFMPVDLHEYLNQLKKLCRLKRGLQRALLKQAAISFVPSKGGRK